MKTQFKVKCTAVTPQVKRINKFDTTTFLADFVIIPPSLDDSAEDKRLFFAYTGASLQLSYVEEGRFIVGNVYYLLMSDDKQMFTLTNT